MAKSRVERETVVDMTKVSQDATKEVTTAAAVATRTQAAVLAPVDTGNLAGSIEWRNAGEYDREVFTNVEYAAVQEFKYGNAFMRPAVDIIRKKLGPLWSRAFRKAYARNKR